MLMRIRAWFAPPVFEDEEQTSQASLLNVISLAILAMFVVAGATVPFTTETPVPPLMSTLIGIFLQLGTIFLMRRRHIRLASLLLCIALWAIITAITPIFGGIGGPLVAGYAVVILAAGLLLGGLAGVGFAALGITSSLGILYAESHNLLPWRFYSVTLVSAWVVYTAILGAVALLLSLATRSLADALERTRRMGRIQADANQELNTLRAALEERVADLEQTKESLRDSTALYQTLVENLPQSIFVKDVEGRFVFANQRFCRELGKTFADIAGKNDYDIHPPEQAKKYRADDQRIMQSGGVFEVEEARQVIGGNPTYVNTVKTPTYNSRGQVSGIQGIFWDVTDRKRAEDILRQSHEELEKQVQARTAELAKERNLLRTVIDNLPDYIFVKDTDSRYILNNTAHLASIGASMPEQVFGKTAYDFFPAEMAAQFISDEKEILSSGHPLIQREERVLRQGTGEAEWHLTTKVPLQDSNANIIGLVGIARDITERKRIEEALAHERNLLRTLIDALPDYIYIKDTQSRFILTNTTQARHLGAKSVDDLIGKTDRDYYPKDLAAKFLADDQALIQSGKPLIGIEEPTVDAAGNWKWTLTTKVPFWGTDGKIAGLVGSGRDITNQKQAEAALAKERNLLRTLIDNFPDAIFVKDNNGRFTISNPSHAALFGFKSPEQLIGKTVAEIFPSEYAASFEADDQRVLQIGQPLINYEKLAPLSTPDHMMWNLSTKVPLRDGTGNIVGLVGIARDITERKQAEQELHRRANEFAALYENTRDLATQQDVSTLLRSILERASTLLAAPGGTIYLYDATRRDLEVVATTDPVAPLGTRLQLNEGMAGRIAQTHEPLIVNDYRSWAYRSQKYKDTPISAVIEVPMLHGGDLIGVLAVYETGDTTRQFTDADTRILSLFAGQAASAMRNARLFEETRQRAQHQETLYRVSTSLASLQGEQELCETVVRACREALGYPYLGIFLQESKTGDRVLYAQSGWEDVPKSWRLVPGEGVTERTLLTGKLHYWPDVTQEPLNVQSGRGTRSEVDVPVKLGDSVLGVMVVEDTHVDAFKSDDFDVLQAVANQLAVALENARLFETVQRELAERKRAEQETLQRNQELAALNQIGQSLNRLADPSEMLELITTMLGRVMDTQNSYIALYDEKTNAISFPVYYIHGERKVVQGRSFGNGLTEFIIQTKTPLLIAENMPDELERRGIANIGTPAYSYLAAPMLIGDRVLGVIAVQDYAKENVFNANHSSLLSTIATQAAIALENARLFATIQTELEERKQIEETLRLQAANLRIAAEVARVVTSLLDLDQVLPRVVDLIRERFGYYHAGVLLKDAAETHIVLRASSSPMSQHDLEGVLQFNVGEGTLVGMVSDTGQPHVAQDVTGDPAYMYYPPLADTRSEAVFPFKVGDTTIGVLDVQSTQLNAFQPGTISILTTIADQIAIAIQNARLHNNEKQRARELEQAYRTLQENQLKLLTVEKMASLGRLTAGIAHEMNTPLAAVRAALTELAKLTDEYQSSIDDADVTPVDHHAIAREMQRSIQIAHTASERTSSFVRSIKSQTRGMATVERRHFNAVSVIEEALLLLRHALRKGNCTIEFEHAANNLELVGPPGRFAQIVTNLVTNAIDASAVPGGGSITLRLAPYPDGLEMQVSDHGCGIPAENLSKIFDPMFTTKPFGEGTGLGLAIVHDIVTGEFGGSIQVTSQVGQGSVFQMRFPAYKETQERQDAA